jgi:hypothetical protein
MIKKDIEIVVAIHHELNAHVFLSNMGRDIPRGYESRTEVQREAKRAER